MSVSTSISPDNLAGLIGAPNGPALFDVRADEEYSTDPRFVPGAVRRDYASVGQWAGAFNRRSVVVIGQRDAGIGQGVAAWLRHAGVDAVILEGGHEAWATTDLPPIPEAKLPSRDSLGRTVWVTRTRPKVDRIACPWLIRRFVDPNAVFLYVAASEVLAVAERFNAAPFDVDGAHWGHRGDHCSFDALIEELGLETKALQRLALIVRGADTGRPDLVPEAAGLLAASLGLSRLYSDDLQQLEAGVTLYDAFYHWCRAVIDEPQTSSSIKSGAKQ
jgi:rhodanese-related sulfurtransferase